MSDLPWRSLLLGAGAIQGFSVALLLVLVRRNRVANRLLAGLLVAVSLAQMPQILGFAGFYGRYPWLSMAPFEMPWLFGPLIWLYTYRLAHGDLPRRWAWLLAPGIVQGLYYSYYFVFLPLPRRWDLVESFHAPLFVPGETVVTLALVAVALVLSVRRYRRYQRWLSAQVSDRENYRLAWLRNFLFGLGVALATALVFEGLDAITPLGYAGMFPMYGVFALLTYYFGFEGYRNAEIQLPVQPSGAEGERVTSSPLGGEPARFPGEHPEESVAKGTSAQAGGSDGETGVGDGSDPDAETMEEEVAGAEGAKDWAAVAGPWVARVEDERLFLDPDLTLSSLARTLATNPSTLSKAINQGLGTNFNDFVNSYRVRTVQDLLADPDEQRSLLDLAFACGFNSKTSFNRSFRRVVGSTPSAWRAASRGARS